MDIVRDCFFFKQGNPRLVLANAIECEKQINVDALIFSNYLYSSFWPIKNVWALDTVTSSKLLEYFMQERVFEKVKES